MKKLNNFKVLIVDDDSDLLALVSEHFLIAGAKVEVATGGYEAINLIKAKHFDFILSDMRMPNGDGRFLAEEVLKITGPKPLFFLYTAYNDINKKELFELGILQVFAKPFIASEMIDSILLHIK